MDKEPTVTCPECQGVKGSHGWFGPEPCDFCGATGNVPVGDVLEDLSANSFLVAMRATDDAGLGVEFYMAARALKIPSVEVVADYAWGRWPEMTHFLTEAQRRWERFTQKNLEDLQNRYRGL